MKANTLISSNFHPRMFFFALFILSLISQNLIFAQCSPLTCTPLNETFGSIASTDCPGSQGDAAATGTAAGVVNLDFLVYSPGNPGNDSEPGDGEYGIRCNGSEPNGGWWSTYSDNTADASGQAGLYLLINSGKGGAYGAAYKNEFFHRTVSNLCVGATYTVSFAAGNVSQDGTNNGCAYGTLPSFQVYASPASTPVQSYTAEYAPSGSSTLLGSTGSIGCTAGGLTWNTYSYSFTPTSSSFDLVLVNLYSWAGGNDFVIDDIKVTWASGAGTGCTTPIELTSFSAEKTSQNVILKWSTASELNFSHFVVEKSTDAINFQQTGIVYGAGNSSRQIDYTFTDNSNGEGIAYYRLKQVDTDGSFKYSVIKSVKADSSTPVLIYSSDGDLIIQFTAKGEAMYTIVDMLGKALYSGNRTSDESSITVSKNNFKTGVYIIKVQMGNEVLTKKIVLN